MQLNQWMNTDAAPFNTKKVRPSILGEKLKSLQDNAALTFIGMSDEFSLPILPSKVTSQESA